MARTANTLAQRNGANAQTLRVYGTYTDASNYERVQLETTAPGLRYVAAGTGSARNFSIVNQSAAGIFLATSNTNRWLFASDGHLLAATDNAYDIGASGATRPRNVYLGGFLLVGAAAGIGASGRSAIDSPSDGVWRMTNAAGTDFDRLQFGGTSASYSAWKRSGATLQARLADDSDFAAFQSLYIRYGSGSPEGAVTAPVGAIYSRTDGGAGTSLYVKESGSGNTGWIAK